MLFADPEIDQDAHVSIPSVRLGSIRYITHEYDLHEVAVRLQRHGYRGAICGPAGSGKTIMLQALGDELMAHGLTPLPLTLHHDRAKALPKLWRKTIRKARHTDALLLDEYDLLPRWARLWVWFASMRAGAVVVTTQHEVRFKTLARPKASAVLLSKIIDQLEAAHRQDIDYAKVLKQCNGNLSESIQKVCALSDTSSANLASGKRQAS